MESGGVPRARGGGHRVATQAVFLFASVFQGPIPTRVRRRCWEISGELSNLTHANHDTVEIERSRTFFVPWVDTRRLTIKTAAAFFCPCGVWGLSSSPSSIMKFDSTGERRFDEETGSINATACPRCGGRITVDGGEIACLGCGIVLNEYARTGSLPSHRQADAKSPAEVA